MTKDEIDEVIAAPIFSHAQFKGDDFTAREIARTIRAALRAHDMEVRPMEPGIGFFDAVERALWAAYEQDGPDQLTDAFRDWNQSRAMITAATPTAGK